MFSRDTTAKFWAQCAGIATREQPAILHTVVTETGRGFPRREVVKPRGKPL
jgi:hypothetical protein